MKYSILATTVAIMIAAATPSSFAAGTGVGVGANAATDNIVTGSTTNADVGSLVTAMSADGTTASSLKGMADISSVTVIKVADVAKGSDQQTVQDALTKNKSNIANLQAAIVANSKLKAKLDEKSIKPSSVVALNVAAGGAVTVFVE